ncbi:MAG: glutamate-5-semialdehyde dehydrogenase [SAR202 cluster bacterium]|jgi:glutamate-5-semialdehyde dehydrogenase|nr:glutamate-5-semialdehyde dehydrogenase [SAR202 cluster bacterium]
MTTELDELGSKAREARKASLKLARISSSVKDRALHAIANGIEEHTEEILEANEEDLSAGHLAGLAGPLLNRLALSKSSLGSIVADVRRITALPDPVGETFDFQVLSNGLRTGKRRVPLGVIGVIYESRPNVTIDIASLCLKSGNAVILRGGKEALNSNTTLARISRDSVEKAGVPPEAIQIIESTDRELVSQMLRMKDSIDLLIPRGSVDLIRRVAAEATMPAITGGVGVCHTYIDHTANLEMAVAIANNAKVSSPYVCNAMDTLLVHTSIAPTALNQLANLWRISGVEMRCDDRALAITEQVKGVHAVPASDADWGTEFLSMTAAIKIVDSLDEAISHIDIYGSGHSDAIVTEDYSSAMRFLDEVDSAVVLVNASSRFNDGGQFGLGAEVAISTNKIHARGPMGLKELTSYKWTVLGTGQVRE